MILLATASIAAMNLTAQIADPTKSVRMSKNGEFIANHYPPKALISGEQGKVGFRLVIESDGSLGTCEVTASSGFQSLDDETCELILRYARLQPVRNSAGRAVRAVQFGFINWKHPSVTGKPASAEQIASAKLPDKIICKRTATTGSLIRRTKQCMTSRDWGEMQRIARDQADRLIARGHASDGMGCDLLTNPSGECN